MEDFSPSGRIPDGGLRKVVFISDVFLIGYHLIPHYPAVNYTTGKDYLVTFRMDGSKEVNDVSLISIASCKLHCKLEVGDTEPDWMAVVENSDFLG